MLIRNFGHLWERKYIYWGRGNVRGHLKGYISQDHEVDFREQIGIYILYDRNLAPVYVGQSGSGRLRLFDRLKRHEIDHLWNRWEHFSWFGFRRVNQNGSLSRHDDAEKQFNARGSQLLNEIEGALITALEPKLNKQGARWKDVEEYYQVQDEELDDLRRGDVIERHDQLEKMLGSLNKKVQKALARRAAGHPNSKRR